MVGLGNPGPRYADSPHNLGFQVLDHLVAREQWPAFRHLSRFSAEVTKGTLAGRSVLALKPQTFMNLSGEAVGAVSRYHRISREHIIAIHDELDLNFGRIKIKRGGSDGGHNGLRSLTSHLGGADYVRVRAGVGRPGDNRPVIDYLLSRWPAAKREQVEQLVKLAAEATENLLRLGLSRAMNRYNAKQERQPAESAGEKSSEASGAKPNNS